MLGDNIATLTYSSDLVLELQRDALKNRVDTPNLTRKALVISKKLGISEVENWLHQELNGYTDSEDFLSEYRDLYGVLKVNNPVRGLIPFRSANATNNVIHTISNPVGKFLFGIFTCLL